MPFPLPLRFCALALALVLFTARVGSVAYETFTVPIQQFLARVPAVSSEDPRPKVRLYKPKHSLIEVAALDASGAPTPPCRPPFLLNPWSADTLLQQDLPQDIYIPPEFRG